MAKRKKAASKAQVTRRMKRMGIEGWSSMGTPTPDDHMRSLDAIEAHYSRRKKPGQK